jgi:integrase
MRTTSATVTAILYKSKTLSNGEHPVMLRVCKGGKRKYVSLGFSCPENLWNKEKNEVKKKHPEHLLIEAIISEKIKEYRNAELESKSIGKVKTSGELIRSVEKRYPDETVLKYFETMIDRFKSTHQIGNANVYTNTKNSFKNFTKSNDYNFSEIDFALLTKYEYWLKERSVSESTLSIHFRTLRAVFNSAIKEGIVNEKYYPFKQFLVTKFKSQPNRRAIGKADIRSIEELDLKKNSPEWMARQIFLFSYYGQGINFIDIAHLRWSNVQNGRIYYKRSKTGKMINFILLDPIKKILDSYSSITGYDSNNFIFPILDSKIHLTRSQVINRIHKKITQTNALLKEIGTDAGLQIKLTTYVARHTFATTLKLQGVSTAIISQAMGHKSENITQNYLKSFHDSIVDDAVSQNL